MRPRLYHHIGADRHDGRTKGACRNIHRPNITSHHIIVRRRGGMTEKNSKHDARTPGRQGREGWGWGWDHPLRVEFPECWAAAALDWTASQTHPFGGHCTCIRPLGKKRKIYSRTISPERMFSLSQTLHYSSKLQHPPHKQKLPINFWTINQPHLPI